MSNALITDQLLTFIEADLNVALGTAGVPFPVFFERPRVAVGSGYPLGYAVVLPASTESSFDGKVATVTRPQRYEEFDIEIRKPIPEEGEPVPFLKITDANAIIAALQAGADYHGIAIWPLVMAIDWESRTDPKEDAYDFRLRFSVYSAADHH